MSLSINQAAASAAASAADPLADELRSWLEWAGARLLSMALPHVGPDRERIFWPAFKHNIYDAYGTTPAQLRPARPSARDIVLMDEILLLPSLIPDLTQRRIVQARALVTPISSRYIYPWSKLALYLHTDRRRVMRLHYLGLSAIADTLPARKAHAIQRSFLSLTAS